MKHFHRRNSLIGLIFGFSAYSIFAVQDGFTKILLQSFSPFQLAMVRFWGFFLLALVLLLRRKGSIKLGTHFPLLQGLRGILLSGHILLGTIAFDQAGLIQTQSIFASGPIFVAFLGVLFLGERISPARLCAILLGMAGVLIVINPGGSVFDQRLVWPLASVLLMALYAVFTRLTSSRDDTPTNTFYAAAGGMVVTSLIGPFFWITPDAQQLALLLALVAIGTCSQWLLLAAYERAEAAAVQSLSFFHLLFGSLVGVFYLAEVPTDTLVIGGLVIVMAGLITGWSSRRIKR